MPIIMEEHLKMCKFSNDLSMLTEENHIVNLGNLVTCNHF